MKLFEINVKLNYRPSTEVREYLLYKSTQDENDCKLTVEMLRKNDAITHIQVKTYILDLMSTTEVELNHDTK